jgi:hypothetical protein
LVVVVVVCVDVVREQHGAAIYSLHVSLFATPRSGDVVGAVVVVDDDDGVAN